MFSNIGGHMLSKIFCFNMISVTVFKFDTFLVNYITLLFCQNKIFHCHCQFVSLFPFPLHIKFAWRLIRYVFLGADKRHVSGGGRFEGGRSLGKFVRNLI